MAMRVFITAATTGEWMPTYLDIPTLYTSDSSRLKIHFHQSGVGLLSAAVQITRLAVEEKPDLIIQAGIAGAFDPSLTLGRVVTVGEDQVGDMGVEEENRWKDIFDMKLEKGSYPPFEKRKLPNHFLEKYNLLHWPEVTAITVNEITTRPERIDQLVKKYNPGIESMEGAALHYVGRMLNIPFIQVRSISNYVGERDKSKWMMRQAIDHLNQALLKYAERLYKMK